MKKVLLCVGAALAIQFATLNAQTNLVDNPGFEDGIGSWVKRGSDSIAIDATISHTGTNSLLMTMPTWTTGAVLENIPCERGIYTYSAWLKGDSSYIFPLLDGLDQNGDPLETKYWDETDYLLTSADNWTNVSFTFTVNPEVGATNLVLRLIVISKKIMPDTKVWVDDVSLVKVNPKVEVDPNNLVQNASFEEGISPWVAYSGNNDESHAKLGLNVARSGDFAMEINTPNIFAEGEPGAGIGQNDIPCDSISYTYSAWVKGDSTIIGGIVSGLDENGDPFDGRYVGGTDIVKNENPDIWKQISVTLIVKRKVFWNESDFKLRLYVYSFKHKVGSQVLIDDVSLIKNTEVGYQDISEESVMTYPNPVVDKLHISLKSNNAKVSIYNINGQIVIESVLADLQGSVDVSSLAKGVYFVKVDNKFVKKIVK